MNISVPPHLAYPEDKIRWPRLSLLPNAYALMDKGITIAVSRKKESCKNDPLLGAQGSSGTTERIGT